MAPIAQAQASGGMEQVTQAREQGQAPQLEHGAGGSPGVEAAIKEEAHGRLLPAHKMAEIEFFQKLKESLITEAMKVVITLDRHTDEIKAGGHAAEAVIGLQQHGPAAFQCQLIGDGQAHRAAADHGYGGGRRFGHQKGIATEENLGSR